MSVAHHVPRHLDWPGCRNARDLGGLPTSDGGSIRDLALIRTDNLYNLTSAGVDTVRALAPSRIIDLRRAHELAARPNPFAGDPAYRNLSVMDPADPDNEHLPLAKIYTAMLDTRPALFASAVAAIADAPAGSVIVHCAGGKDRTGLVVGMALSLAGISPDLIAADYALTEHRLAEEYAEVLARTTDPELREVIRKLQPTPASNLLEVLAHLDSTYGGVEPYLAKGGLTGSQRTALVERLVQR